MSRCNFRKFIVSTVNTKIISSAVRKPLAAVVYESLEGGGGAGTADH